MGLKDKLVERVMGIVATDADVKNALLEAINGVSLDIDFEAADGEMTFIITVRERPKE